MDEEILQSDLFKAVHKSHKIEWQGANNHGTISTLVGKRACVCIAEHNSEACYFPTCPPNVQGYITAWIPSAPDDGLTKFCWLGSNGDKLVLSSQDAYRAVRNADTFHCSEGSCLVLQDVLRARDSVPSHTRKSRKLDRRCTAPLQIEASATEATTDSSLLPLQECIPRPTQSHSAALQLQGLHLPLLAAFYPPSSPLQTRQRLLRALAKSAHQISLPRSPACPCRC